MQIFCFLVSLLYGNQKKRGEKMKKMYVAVLSLFSIILCFTVEVYAKNDSYESFNEIIMVEGKLLSNFTESEFAEYYQKVRKRKFWGINVYVINQNVDATYISSTLYSVDNQGDTDINYELDIEVETANKTTWNVSGELSSTTKGTVMSFKTDLDAKVGMDYTVTSSESCKENQRMKLTVEKQSRAIVYLMGNARVTNGVCACYIFFINVATCGFEYFTIVNQYPRLEKRKL